jgi:hypothetical protein
MEFDPADDADLLKVAQFYDESPEDKAYRLMKARIDDHPEWKDLWERIVDAFPMDEWPTFLFRIMMGMSPLSHTARFHLITWFFINGMYPRLAIEWCGYMGALVGTRKSEMERTLLELDRLTRTRDPKLANWHGYCMDKKKMVDLLNYNPKIKRQD